MTARGDEDRLVRARIPAHLVDVFDAVVYLHDSKPSAAVSEVVSSWLEEQAHDPLVIATVKNRRRYQARQRGLRIVGSETGTDQ